ncbi:unnamed protein product [Discula destructiva]
MTCARGR